MPDATPPFLKLRETGGWKGFFTASLKPLTCRENVCDSHDSLFEVTPERVRLVVLNLAVLDGSAAQKLVELDGVNSGRTLFILRGLRTDPVVDIVGKSATCLLSLEEIQGALVEIAYLSSMRSLLLPVCLSLSTNCL